MAPVATPPLAPPTPVRVMAHEKIALRAYERWCQRGCTHGHDMQDWLEAEAELRNDQERSTIRSQPRR